MRNLFGITVVDLRALAAKATNNAFCFLRPTRVVMVGAEGPASTMLQLAPMNALISI